MTDIATLGLSVDSRQVAEATPRLDKLSAAAKRASGAAAEFGQGAKLASAGADSAALSLTQARAAAVQHAQALAVASRAQLQVQRTAGLSSYALTNLGFQINDVATQAALGVTPLRILAAQGGQFFQILAQGEGGVRASFGQLARVVAGMVTPFRLAAAAAAGIGAAAISSALSMQSAQREITIGLLGIGAAAGVTADDINAITESASRAGRVTKGEARSIALAFALTGKVGANLTGQLVELNSTISTVFGESAAESAKRLAKAFTDPAKGVDDLNSRLLAFDASAVRNIQNLAAQNRTFEAQRALIDGIKQSTALATNETSGWAAAWARMTAPVSKVLSDAGEAVARFSGSGTFDQRLRDAQELLRKAEAGPGFGLSYSADFIDQQRQRVEKLTEAIRARNKAEAEAPGIARSLDLSKTLDDITPQLKALRDAANLVERLKTGRLDAAAFSRLPADQQAGYDRALQVAQQQAESARLKLQYDRSSLEIAKEDQAFALQSIAAKSAAQQAELAFQQTLARERRAGNVNAEFEAAAARDRVLAEANDRLTETLRDLAFAGQQNIDQARNELSLIGQSAGETARLRAEFQALAEAKAEAFRDRRELMQSEIDLAKNNARAIGELAQRQAELNLAKSLAFERQQLGRSPIEQEVYARLQSAGLLSDGQITSAAGEAAAAQIRLNDQIARGIEMQKEFGSTLIRGMVEGASATETLGNALERLASRLLDSTLDKAFGALFSGGSLFGGGDVGLGSWAASILHNGGVAGNDNMPRRSVPAAVFAGAKRYHGGGVIGSDEVPAILQKGEVVLPRGAKVGAGGDAPVVVHVNTTIDAKGAYPESIAQITASVERLKAELPGRIVSQMRNARERRIA